MEPILPPDPDGVEFLHGRDYKVRAFRVNDSRVLLRGAIRDFKPPGAYIPNDPEELVIHHMTIDILVSYPEFEIVDIDAKYLHFPEESCPNIAEAYKQLIGVSIQRGFNRRLKELLGGPLGCTHLQALVSAMAPVIVQCMWSLRNAEIDSGAPVKLRSQMSDEELLESVKFNRNSCHVWADGGEVMNRVLSRDVHQPPLTVRRRLAQHGLKMDNWSNRRLVPLDDAAE